MFILLQISSRARQHCTIGRLFHFLFCAPFTVVLLSNNAMDLIYEGYRSVEGLSEEHELSLDYAESLENDSMSDSDRTGGFSYTGIEGYEATSPLMYELREVTDADVEIDSFQLSSSFSQQQPTHSDYLLEDEFEFEDEDEETLKYYKAVANVIMTKLDTFVIDERQLLVLFNRQRAKAREVCAVCLEIWSQDGQHIVKLDCKHVFHKECLHKWCAFGNLNCPICRHHFVT